MLTVRKPELVRRLTNMLGLEIGPIAPDFSLSQQIVLVNPLDALLRSLVATTGTIAVSGAGYQTILTVPAGKRAIVHFFNAWQSTGTFTISSAYIDQGSHSVLIYTQIGAAALNFTASQKSFKLDENMLLKVNVNSVTTGGNMNYSVYYEEEDAY